MDRGLADIKSFEERKKKEVLVAWRNFFLLCKLMSKEIIQEISPDRSLKGLEWDENSAKCEINMNLLNCE